MTQKEIREHLGRVKPYYLRNDTLRALASAVSGLKGLGAAVPGTDVRTLIREAVQMLSRDQDIRKHVKEGALIYQPGNERAILAHLTIAYQAMREAAEIEEREVALARKIRMDQAYNQGVRHLEQGRASDADACFSEAVANYRNEHSLFGLIGKTLMNAGEARRALPYFKRGVEAKPEDAEMRNLYDECLRLRDGA